MVFALKFIDVQFIGIPVGSRKKNRLMKKKYKQDIFCRQTENYTIK